MAKAKKVETPVVFTKDDLIEELVNGFATTKADGKQMVETFLNSMSNALSEGREIRLTGFGAFKTKIREARVGRNPHSGEAVDIPQKTVVSFKPAKQLKDLVDQ